MSAIDYLLGKDAGRSEANVAADIKAAAAERSRLQSQRNVNDLIDALEDTRERLGKMRDRFVRERRERMSWQKAANFRKIMLRDIFHMSEQEIYDMQHKYEADEKIHNETNAFIDNKTREIDESMGV